MADFADSDEEAARRAAVYETEDPFPTIPPALLSSAQIGDYVAATGMIYPFAYKAAKLKPASYEVDFGGPVRYFDEDVKQMIPLDIADGQPFMLRANSIAFVSCRPMFRLPNYLAIRFNLKIAHVYKGLLLGTGPLVDPGFQGVLSLPLHNLTNNDYELVGGAGLIWLEVTKLLVEPPPRKDLIKQRGTFFPFDVDKRNLTIDQYLRKAKEDRLVGSSIPELVADSKAKLVAAVAAADKAASAANFVRNLGIWGAIATLIAVLIGAVAVYVAVHTVLDATNARVDTVNNRVDSAVRQPMTAADAAALQGQLCTVERQLNQPLNPACQALNPAPTASPAHP